MEGSKGRTQARIAWIVCNKEGITATWILVKASAVINRIHTVEEQPPMSTRIIDAHLTLNLIT